eukprot:4069946-Pyramimonas_sp.AAC.1
MRQGKQALPVAARVSPIIGFVDMGTATTRSRSPANTFLHCAGSTRAPFLLDVFAPGPVLGRNLSPGK